MKYFHKIGNCFDTTPVRRELQAQPLAWGQSPRITFPGSPHADAYDIVLRGPVGFEYKSLAELHGELSCEDYAAAELFPKTLALGRNLAYLLSSEEERRHGGLQLGRVILTKLEPGKTIHPHRDEGPVPAFYRRIHMCVQGGDENVMIIHDETKPMQTSEMWEVDVRHLHTAINLMEWNRIHLIVDVERDI